jgi:excinuclease UvrABC nuclease subunit
MMQSLLSWKGPFQLSKLYENRIPYGAGVYMLLADANDPNSVVYIGAANNLRTEYQREIEVHAQVRIAKASAFSFAETPFPNDQAEKLIEAFRRRHGRKPALNSGF